MQWVFDKGAIFGGSRVASSPRCPAALRRSSSATNDELVARGARRAAAALPDVRAATAPPRQRRSRAARDVLARARPAARGRRRETPLRGFYLAGDWIDTGLPATIEAP